MEACFFLVSRNICSHNSECSHHSRHSSPSMLSRRSPGNHAARGLLHVRSPANMILVHNMDPLLRIHSRNGGTKYKTTRLDVRTALTLLLAAARPKTACSRAAKPRKAHPPRRRPPSCPVLAQHRRHVWGTLAFEPAPLMKACPFLTALPACCSGVGGADWLRIFLSSGKSRLPPPSLSHSLKRASISALGTSRPRAPIASWNSARLTWEHVAKLGRCS